MNPRRTRDYRKGTDEHLPTPILGRAHEPILPREFRVSKPEINLARLFRRFSGSPHHEPPYLLHQRLDIIGAVEEGRVTHPVALEEALVEDLARSEGAARHVPGQVEELHPLPGIGRIRLQVLLDLPA